MLIRSKISLTIALFWLLLITTLLCTSGTKFPKIGWQDKIWLDKWVHIVLFFALTYSWCRVFFLYRNDHDKTRKIFLIVVISCIVYGITMEIIQGLYIPFRSFELEDILADSAGAGIGYFIIQRQNTKIRNKID